jgi:hypothetical protein
VDPVAALAERLSGLGWVTDLWVAGSLATGDHIPGVSDLDLVAVTDGRVTGDRLTRLVGIHAELDQGAAAGADLGCAYADGGRLADPAVEHPTWTHGRLVRRTVSGVVRAELVRHGYAAFGRPPTEVLAPVTDDDVRRAACEELTGYWAWAARRPHYWLDPVIADLGLTSMARGRHAMATGRLLTKSAAIDQAAAPQWLVDHLRRRRNGEDVSSPRVRTGWIAWRDARRTTRAARATRLS